MPDRYIYPQDGIDQWAALTTAEGAATAAAAAAGNTATANNRTLVHEIGGDNNIHQESFFDGRYVVVCLHKEGEMELKLPNELEHVDGCPINVLSLDQSCSLRTVSMYADNVFGCNSYVKFQR